jgi:hypothetical protein
VLFGIILGKFGSSALLSLGGGTEDCSEIDFISVMCEAIKFRHQFLMRGYGRLWPVIIQICRCYWMTCKELLHPLQLKKILNYTSYVRGRILYWLSLNVNLDMTYIVQQLLIGSQFHRSNK